MESDQTSEWMVWDLFSLNLSLNFSKYEHPHREPCNPNFFFIGDGLGVGMCKQP